MSDLAPILLCEDDPADAELTVNALQQAGIENPVIRANDGAEAIDYFGRAGRFAEEPPGLPAFVIVDLKMPRVGGLEVVRRIKRDPALARIPVIVFTSSDEAKDIEAAYYFGANAYVFKPMHFSEFAAAVRGFSAFCETTSQT